MNSLDSDHIGLRPGLFNSDFSYRHDRVKQGRHLLPPSEFEKISKSILSARWSRMDLVEPYPSTHAKARSVNSLFHPPFHIMSPSSCLVNGPNKRGAAQVSIGCNPSHHHAMLYHDHFVHASNFPFLNSKKSSKHRESHWPKTPPAITII